MWPIAGVVGGLVALSVAHTVQAFLSAKAVEKDLVASYARHVEIPFDVFQRKVEAGEWDVGEERAMHFWLLDYFGRERFANRVADFLGIPPLLVFLLQSVAFAALLIWTFVSFFNDTEASDVVLAWIVYTVASWLVFLLLLIYNWLARILTNRYPGQPKQMRRMLDAYWEELVRKERRREKMSKEREREDLEGRG